MRARLILVLGGAALISACHTGDYPEYPDARMNILAPPPAPPPPPPPPPEFAPPRALPGIAPLTEDNIGPYMDRQEAELRRAFLSAGMARRLAG